MPEKEIEALKVEANQNVTIKYFIDPRKDQWFDNAKTANHGVQPIADKSGSG